MPDATTPPPPTARRCALIGAAVGLSLLGGVAEANDPARLRVEVLNSSGEVQRTIRLPRRVSYPAEWSHVRYRGNVDGALPHDEWYFLACDDRDVYVEGGRKGPMVRVSRCRETRFGFTIVTLASAGTPSSGRRATFCLDHTSLVSVYYGFYGVTEEQWRRRSIFATAVHRDALVDLGGGVTVRGVCERQDPRELTVEQRQPRGFDVFRVGAAPPAPSGTGAPPPEGAGGADGSGPASPAEGETPIDEAEAE